MVMKQKISKIGSLNVTMLGIMVRTTFPTMIKINGSLSKRTDAKILIIIFKLLDESLIVFFVLSREENYIIL